MTEIERENHMLFIINSYGINSQQDMAIEELSELQKAIVKHRRFHCKETEQDIVDEIADVQIMLEQLKIIYSCSREVEERIDYKLERQTKRILKKYNLEEL